MTGGGYCQWLADVLVGQLTLAYKDVHQAPLSFSACLPREGGEPVSFPCCRVTPPDSSAGPLGPANGAPGPRRPALRLLRRWHTPPCAISGDAYRACWCTKPYTDHRNIDRTTNDL